MSSGVEVQMRALFILTILSLVACAASPPPKVDDPVPHKAPAPTPTEQSEKTPAQLCEHYVALAEATGKLDSEYRKVKLDKCIVRAKANRESAPKFYACLVKCTFAAQNYEKARGCPFECRDAEAPNPGGAPPPADSD